MKQRGENVAEETTLDPDAPDERMITPHNRRGEIAQVLSYLARP